MIRKMLVVAAAIAMPVSVIAIPAFTSGVAGAHTVVPADPPVTCSVSGTVTFAPPGLSSAGSAEAAKDSVSTTSPTTFGAGCTGGSGTGYSITSKSIKCAKKATDPEPSSNPGCEVGEYGYDSWSNFTTGGTTAIQKALKKLNFTLNGIAYETKTTSASQVVFNACGSEVGFQLNGTVAAPKQDKGQSSQLIACLGAVTGTGLTSYTNFFDDYNGPGTVATAQIDPSVSTVEIAGGS
jgi:hypothetical protein